MAVAGARPAVQEASRRQDRKRLREQVSFVVDWTLLHRRQIFRGSGACHNLGCSGLCTNAWTRCELRHHFSSRYVGGLAALLLGSIVFCREIQR